MNREQHLEKALKSIIDFGDKEAPISYFRIRDIAREAILRPVEPAADGGREALRQAVVNLLQIGKRDLTNPKYHSYFDELVKNIGLEPATPAPVDNVALLEWVEAQGYEFYRPHGVWIDGNGLIAAETTAALIQEFINQKTKEV